ncbi:hypothetical protein, partial [Caldivirga sp.]|uniref:hypothetical protein n=1 Tax=Caldivirga sp. TaxID=2080243 RepID=UPI003D0D67BA
LTITPNNIKPKYKIKIIKNNETLKALMSIAGELSQSLLRNPPLVVRPPVHGASTLLDPSNPTWALSAFANVNSSNVVCGYAYPDNGSDLIIPSSDFAGVPLTILQELEYNVVGGFGYLMIQVGVNIWPPSLAENVWYNTEPLSYGLHSLTSPIDWLATGATLCITQLNPSDSDYAIMLTVIANGESYTIATVSEQKNGNYYNISVTLGSGVNGNSTSINAPVTPVLDSVSYSYSPTTALYPSMAFESNDSSPLFFSNNTSFALILQLGNGPSTVGSWPLFYSISDDLGSCSGVWGSSGVGYEWPPSSGDGLWGAGGLTVEYTGEPVSYEALIGSLSQMKSSVIVNTVGISCQYVDTKLSALNTEG